MYEFVYESCMSILDDAVDKELDAVDDLMSGAGDISDCEVADCLIPDSLVDAETDNTDFEKYIDKEEC